MVQQIAWWEWRLGIEWFHAKSCCISLLLCGKKKQTEVIAVVIVCKVLLYSLRLLCVPEAIGIAGK